MHARFHDDAKAEITEIADFGYENELSVQRSRSSDGRYEISIKRSIDCFQSDANARGRIQRRETFRPSKARLVDSSKDPHKILLVLRKESLASYGGSGMSYPLSKADFDESGDVSRDEFQSHVGTIAGFPINGHTIISN